MASSSGWAIRRQIRLLWNFGNELRVICAVYSQAVASRMGTATAR